jgi:hypothetical protein
MGSIDASLSRIRLRLAARACAIALGLRQQDVLLHIVKDSLK